MANRMSVAERRARVVRRHHLGRTAPALSDSVNATVGLHSSDPASPYLSARARLGGFAVEDLEQALFDDRSLWRMHAMRRTLFVVCLQDAAIFDAAAGRSIAGRERTRLVRDLSAEIDPDQAADWLEALETDILALLDDGAERRTADLAAALPALRTAMTVGSGKWSGQVPVSSRLLPTMAMDGRIVRARPAGTWRSSQYRWAATARWFGEVPDPMEPQAGRTALLGRYLGSYGPATIRDIRWWTGWTARRAEAAIAASRAMTVDIDGSTGYVLAEDLDASEPPEPTVALLPGLDSTPMGWKERSWYIGGHGARLFDRNGNVGPTVWVNGRVAGGWGQRPDGEVVYRLLEDLGTEMTRLVDAAADDLTRWMDGVAVTPRFRTPLERTLTA